MIFTSLITVLTLILYLVLGILVSKARSRYAISAPAISGNLDFERRYRVQMNTLEQMAVFLPALWLFEFYWVPQVRLGIPWSASHVSAALGLLWIIGRILYAHGYYRASQKRGPGFALSFIVTCVLLLWSFAGICYVLLHTHYAV